jgi:transketolase
MSTALSLDIQCVNAIRTLSIDAVQEANSGHPGLPLGAAPMAYVLWHRHLRHNPSNPDWHDRDRFVLSAGHGSMLLYSLLHLSGYDVTLEDLKSFRQWESKTPGHPESFMTPGVEATTGPLGQGTANAVGMAVAERMLAHRFNRSELTLVDHHTYALVSDGDLMEGVAAEAASIAGQLRLGKLIYLYDANDVTLDGPTSWTFSTEDVERRFEAQGWHVQRVEDGDHDLEGIDKAISAAKAEGDRPSLIMVRTTIGFGSPNKQGSSSAHGAPLGEEEVALTKKALGCDPSLTFHVSDEVREHFRRSAEVGRKAESEWNARFGAYRKAHPELAAEWQRRMASELPGGWEESLPSFEPGSKLATRDASGKVMNAIAARVPELVGGDADLSSSTKTALKELGDFDGQTGAGRNIRFGVREHAMGSIVNGMAYHGGVRPYSATFFVFSDYMRPAVRLAALSGLPAICVWTHDSIGVGEDGPTHQPVEHLMALRAVPNLHVIRPADANETTEAWRCALERADGPTALVLTRQKIATVDRTRYASAAGLRRGAYVLSEAQGGKPSVILIASGSEVALALEAQQVLESTGRPCRVVSIPCWERFDEQAEEYRESVLPADVKARVAIEAGVGLGWHRFVGDGGKVIAIDRFGASAPGDENMKRFGFSVDNVVATVETLA